MSAYRVSSKFRHIYGDPAKGRASYSDIRGALTSGESQYVKANGKFLAYGKTTGGAPLFVRKLSDVGRTGTNAKYISTHRGRLTDFDFHPFIETLVATGADDCKVMINQFPMEGLTENINKSVAELKGHRKKIALIKFNPAANNIIASASYDRTCKVWNVETSSIINDFNEFKGNIYSIAWNKDGSLLGTTSKDKTVRVYDPRKAEECISIAGAFGGIKSTKCFFINAYGWIGSTGFSKSAKRELKIWDPRNAKKPIFTMGIDNQANVLIPHMDDDLNILYTAGKGDNSITYYEIKNDNIMLHSLSLYRSQYPQKGGGWVPKRGLNVMRCEVERFLKLTRDSIIPISLIVPRKSGSLVFQEDIYPPCAASKAGVSADDWCAGTNRNPQTMSMDPDDRNDDEHDDIKVEFKDKETAQAQRLSKLQKDYQILRNERDKIQQCYKQQQIQTNDLRNESAKYKKNIETMQLKLDELTQNLLNDKSEEEEKKENEAKYLSKLSIDLQNEIELFKQNYNEQKLMDIFDKSPNELIQNNSAINENINKYNNNAANIIESSKSFIKYINDIQSFIKKISIPNVNEYKSWNLQQIMAWIMSLENGKYIKFADKLREGFMKSEILTGELLPEITRGDLSNPPFSINQFVIKKNLENHFKSLANANLIPYVDNNINIPPANQDNNEGNYTQVDYIDR